MYSNIGKNRAKQRQANKRNAWVTQCPPGWRVIVPANRAPKLTRNKPGKVAP